jgi:uncharacterized protein YbjT (DUF2867 family)
LVCVSIVDVRDIAAVAVKALAENGRSYDRHIGKIYTITGPEALSYYQAAKILSNTTGKKISYVYLSKEDFVTGWWNRILENIEGLTPGSLHKE